jgi:O-antigen ligase
MADKSAAILLFRPVTVATFVALTLLLWCRVPATRAERQFAAALAILCLVLLAPSLASVDPARAMLEWLKLLIVCVVALMACRVLRYPAIARAFGISLIVASVVLGIFIVATYVKYMGWALPTYAATRGYKGAVQKAGTSLNYVAFDCVFMYVCGMCLVRGRKYLWFVGAALLLISATLTGSRTPLAIFTLSGLLLLVINALRSRRPLAWATGTILAAGMVIGMALAAAETTPRELSYITETRSDLWSVALRKFSERPILGYGYQSAQDDPTYLTGGYHNEYLTAAAEQGIVGLAPVLYLFWFMFRSSWKLTFRRSYTWRNGQWALLGCFLIILHATVELGGLFGTAQGPGDFLASIFVAMVASQFSREEDYIKSFYRQPARATAPMMKMKRPILSGSMDAALS